MSHWGYTKTTGPHTWAVDFPAASGRKQSPVDVESTQAAEDNDLQKAPLSFSYDASTCTTFKNTGHGWQVAVQDGNNVLSGGPLAGEYRLKQFHCHWGRNDSVGSEHTVDGKSYAGEIHLVHWNASKYGTFEEAANHDDGLAVIGILLQPGKAHAEIEKMADVASQVRFTGDSVEIPEGINLHAILPANHSYFTYSGSLTTPPCSEIVTWLLLQTPIEVSSEQLSDFRTLLSYKRDDRRPHDEFRGYTVENFRPPMPLCGRTVRKCQC